MKTFAKFVLNDDSPIVMKNLIPAIIVTIICISMVASVGALLAWALTPFDEPVPFKVYVFLGLMLLGAINGVSTLVGIFASVMKFHGDNQ